VDAHSSAREPADDSYTVQSAPSLSARLGGALRSAIGDKIDLDPNPVNPEYTEDETEHEYIRSTGDYDPEPDGEWSPVSDEEFVINAAGFKKIEDNLGFYLSVIGMTVEMIDPYCGPVLANNFDNVISHWTPVIGHYPAAAKFFLDGKSGILFAWIGAIQATWPILYAIFEHHLARRVEVKNGIVYRRNDSDSPKQDATTPPMPNYNFTTT
jgi:hypothetical protein